MDTLSLQVMIGRHAPQFLVDMSLSTHQDSHELLVFLLDGLHEDLNLVKKKPYVDMDIKTEERSDGVSAIMIDIHDLTSINMNSTSHVTLMWSGLIVCFVLFRILLRRLGRNTCLVTSL